MNYLESYRNCTTKDELFKKVEEDCYRVVNKMSEKIKEINDAAIVVATEKKWEVELIEKAKEKKNG